MIGERLRVDAGRRQQMAEMEYVGNLLFPVVIFATDRLKNAQEERSGNVGFKQFVLTCPIDTNGYAFFRFVQRTVVREPFGRDFIPYGRVYITQLIMQCNEEDGANEVNFSVDHASVLPSIKVATQLHLKEPLPEMFLDRSEYDLLIQTLQFGEEMDLRDFETMYQALDPIPCEVDSVIKFVRRGKQESPFYFSNRH